MGKEDGNIEGDEVGSTVRETEGFEDGAFVFSVGGCVGTTVGGCVGAIVIVGLPVFNRLPPQTQQALCAFLPFTKISMKSSQKTSDICAQFH